ncbi:hypothetical protein KCU0303001_17690 [Corynebacterium ulcerans]
MQVQRFLLSLLGELVDLLYNADDFAGKADHLRKQVQTFD